MKKQFKKIKLNRKLKFIISFVSLISILSFLNFSFSAFTNRHTKNLSNIKVHGMEYSVSINGNQTTVITAQSNKVTNSNIVITSLNNIDSKYELVYKVCSDMNCNNVIDKPDGLSVEYSSRTVDSVTGSINKNSGKSIRIITINDTNKTYYIKLDLNAGYIHNTLALQNLIVNEYNEEDVIIAATILGEISTTFPTTDGYTTKVTCTTNNGPSNASGTATWNGTKWVVNITGADSGRTICNVEFIDPTLKGQILAQGRGANTIAGKGTPNFNIIAPAILTYKELTSSYTSNISSSANKVIGTSYIFDELTGNYTLINYQTGQTYGQEHIGQYTCNSTSYANCITMYKINEITGSNLTNSTRYQKEVNTVSYSDTGLYATLDDYGTSYYYRGDKELLNNNLIWAGFQWKIVRINGDGSVKLVYNGTEDDFISNKQVNSTGSNTQITTNKWNLAADDAKYAGYMFGGAIGVASTMRHGLTSEAATFNETDSNIKTILDNWYKTNIVDKGHSNIVADSLFCNDRQLQSEVGGSSAGPGYGKSNTETYYAVKYRVQMNKIPTLKCGLQNDRFTVNDLVIGNGTLTYPVGLLTADEASMAGLHWSSQNSKNYLYTNSDVMLFSPYQMRNVGYVYIVGVGTGANLYDNNVSNTKGVRPSISISSSVIVTGEGSSTDPFVIK